MKVRSPLMALLAVVFAAVLVLPAVAAPRCFPETNQCLDGRILQYWESNGGTPVFGFPATISAYAAPIHTALTRITTASGASPKAETL